MLISGTVGLPDRAVPGTSSGISPVPEARPIPVGQEGHQVHPEDLPRSGCRQVAIEFWEDSE